MTAAPDAAAFCSARRASSPQQEPRMARFSPALARAPFGRKPPRWAGSGFALGLRTMPAVFSFSTTITSCSLTRRVEIFSAQSRRRSVTAAVIWAMARRVFSRRRDPLPACTAAAAAPGTGSPAGR